MAQTSTPKKAGLTVARNKNKFVLTWTPIKNCTDQDVKVYVNGKLKGTYDLGASTKKYTYTLTLSDYYPNKNGSKNKPKLTKVGFKLARQQKKKKESKYSEEKDFEIKVPGIPEYVAPVMDSTNTDTFAYSWARNEKDGDINTTKKMFTRFYWETCLVDEGKDPDWSLAKTQKITKINPTTHARSTNQNSYGNIGPDDPTTIIVVETQADITAKKRRYFHVRSVGPAGVSDYRQSSHHLGGYNSITISENNTENLGSDSTGTSASINLNLGTGYPDDSIQVQYAITTPLIVTTTDSTNNVVKKELSIPNGFNSWNIADTFSGAGVPDTYTLHVSDQIIENTVLFSRVNRIHDNITTYGTPVLINSRRNSDNEISTVIAPLSAPTLGSISVNEDRKEVTISATNNTNLSGTFIAVYQGVGDTNKIIGILPYGTASGTFPGDWGDDDDVAFGIQCFVASYSPVSRAASGATIYSLRDKLMASSGIIWQTDLVSKPPVITSITRYNSSTALIQWEWNWAQADSAEISWSDNPIIWDSTEEPSTYILSGSRNGSRYITGLSATTYYFRIRFIRTVDDTVIYGKYSETKEFLMASGPDKLVLSLSDEDRVVGEDDEITAYWSYFTTDGTPQGYAVLGEANSLTNPTTFTELSNANTNTDGQIKFKPSDFGWQNGSTHYICVRAVSASGQPSAGLGTKGWSDPIALNIAPKPQISISGIGGNNDAIKTISDTDSTYPYALQKMPIEFMVSGCGPNGYCTVSIERTQNYDIERPDDTTIVGFDGETIYSQRIEPDDDGVANIRIEVDDLIGRLDNTALYRMTVTIVDEFGQSDSATYDFAVEWDYYAQMPTASITIDEANDIAIITPSAPSAVAQGDYCQIYRMSADKPQLILKEGIFGTAYVDQYPTFGKYGGYRIVYVTKYGDYKTSDNILAMTEYSKSGNDEDINQYDKFIVSIKFDDNLVEFPGNISVSNSWAKDFQMTKYLGGSIQGDWNPGVQRTGTINGTVPVEHESETVYGLRILADYSGICHVRTPEGSNFYGDVQVKDDREEKWVTRLSKVSLSYTKVDATEDDLPTYSEWLADQQTQ